MGATGALLAVFMLSLAACDETPPLIFKYVEDFELIWDDSGSGADDDVSFWRPRAFAHDYYPLGDVVTPSHSQPILSAMLVKEMTPWSLKMPQSFQEIWRDKGSGADEDVRVFRMVPYSGFTCLGHVVVANYYKYPDQSTYRCVNSAYVSTGALDYVWDDDGSGADKDFYSWRVVRGTDYDTQESGTFISATSSSTTEAPHILNSNYAKSHLLVPQDSTNKDAPIQLFKTPDLDDIWSDRGSGAKRDFSCWRAKSGGDTYSLGDVPKGHYSKPSYGVVAKASTLGALLAPYDYRKVWDDSGSGADRDGSFWEPLCQSNYVAVGYVCNNNHRKPSLNAVRCVKYQYTSTGRWSWVWSDKGSGADNDVQIYEMLTNGVNQQQINSIGANPSYDLFYKTAYILKADQTVMIDAKPAKSYTITNVRYNLDDRKIVGNQLSTLARLTVENKASTPQSATRTLTGSWTESKSWSQNIGLQASVSVTVVAGIPDVASTAVTVGFTASYAYTTGGSMDEKKEDSTSATISVPAHSQISVFMVGKNYKADVPFTADITTQYEDGTYGFRFGVKGTFHDVTVSDTRVVYEDPISLPNN